MKKDGFDYEKEHVMVWFHIISLFHWSVWGSKLVFELVYAGVPHLTMSGFSRLCNQQVLWIKEKKIPLEIYLSLLHINKMVLVIQSLFFKE